MDCIKLMIDEHKNIKRVLEVIRKTCYRILKGEEVQHESFYKMIDFVRNYADKHHHGKEETLLFNKMMEELGPTAEKLVRLGMYVEHDLGRLHIQELEAALKRVLDGDEESKLDVIANAISYTHLLHRHIEKEDTTVFMYGQKNLAQRTLEEINESCERFEHAAEEKGIQQKYMALIDELEASL